MNTSTHTIFSTTQKRQLFIQLISLIASIYLTKHFLFPLIKRTCFMFSCPLFHINQKCGLIDRPFSFYSNIQQTQSHIYQREEKSAAALKAIPCGLSFKLTFPSSTQWQAYSWSEAEAQVKEELIQTAVIQHSDLC